MNFSTDKFRKVFGYILVSSIALYLVISLYILLVPGASFINKKATQYYNWFALPGPYFRDDRIQVIPHFSLSYKSAGGEWSQPRNLEFENFLSYHDGLNYQLLKRSRYERFMAKALARDVRAKGMSDLQKRRSFTELHTYLKYHYLPGDTDSVRFVYELEALNNHGTDSITTVYAYEFKSN